MKKTSNYLSIIFIVSFFFTCPISCGLFDREPLYGILSVLTGNSLSKTGEPARSELTITSFRVSGSGPNNETFEPILSSTSPITINNLLKGTWSITVDGLNDAGQIVISTVQNIEIAAGKTASADFDRRFSTDTGDSQLMIEWPGFEFFLDSAAADLKPTRYWTIVEEKVDTSSEKYSTLEHISPEANSTEATAREINSLDFKIPAAEPALSPAAGIDVDEQTVKISPPTVEAETYDATDGTDSSDSGMVDTSSDAISPDTTIHDITVLDDFGNSEITETQMVEEPADATDTAPYHTSEKSDPDAIDKSYGEQPLDTEEIERDTTFIKISSGDYYTMAVSHDNSLWVVGANSYGQLGDGTVTDRLTPVQIMSDVADVSAGSCHTMILKTDGTLWGTGSNFFGQLGDGTTNNRLIPVQILSDTTAVASGMYHTMMLKEDNTLWAAGSNFYGQLGDGTMLNKSTPVLVLSDVAAVTAGDSHTMILKTDNTLWAAGANYYGQLGDGTTTDRSAPVQVLTDVTAISAGSCHTMVLKTDNTLWAAGANYYGQLGDGTTTNQYNFVKIMADVADFSTGSSHSMILKTDGTLWAAGANYYGQLGINPPCNLRSQGSADK